MVCKLLIAGASLIVAHRFSCSVPCGIFPDQGSNAGLLHLQANSLLLSHQGSPWSLSFHKLAIYLSVVVSQKLIRIFFGHTARLAGSQLLNEGSNPGTRDWKLRVLTPGSPGKS